MGNQDMKQLRKQYDECLADAWRHWRDAMGNGTGTPFTDLTMCPDLENDAGYNHTLGWVTGVSDATGWSTQEPRRKVAATK